MTIHSEASYQQALSEFERLLEHESDYEAILVLRDAIAAYEQALGYNLPAPQTLVGRLELEMYRRRLNKKKLAELLEISASRMSDVFQGRRINLDLAKRLHQKLGISGDFILETA